MTFKKVVLIGLDAVTVDMLNRYGTEGKLPNLQKLMKEGFTTESFCALPPATSVNWNTVSTGCYAGTHGVTAMAMHLPGREFYDWESGFNSNLCKAERIWQAAERVGKKCILLKYTTSWPPTLKDGIQVHGYGDPNSCIIAISPRCLFATHEMVQPRYFGTTKAPYRTFPMKFELKFTRAEVWINLPHSGSVPLETVLRITPTDGEPQPVYALLLNRDGKGYDRIVISPKRDYQQKWAELRQGEWSSFIKADFLTHGSGVLEGNFRFKLIELSPDGKRVTLFQSQIHPTTGWTKPDSLAAELTEKIGPFQGIAAAHFFERYHWLESEDAADQIVEEFTYHEAWLGNAAEYLLGKKEWDFFATQLHSVDLIAHSYFACLNPEHPFHARGSRAMEDAYRLCDNYVGKLMTFFDENTLVVVTSDHGYMLEKGEKLDVDTLLEENGLVQFQEETIEEFDHETGKDRKKKIKTNNWAKTKASESSNNFIYVNLKGRDPRGIVDPADYHAVCDQVVKIIEKAPSPSYPDERYAQIVLKKEDAEVFGLGGDRVGDVIYLAKPHLLGSHHGNFHTSRGDIGSMRAVTIFHGKGIRKGVFNTKPIHLVDIAPTISYLTGIPPPHHSEGRILYEIVEE